MSPPRPAPCSCPTNNKDIYYSSTGEPRLYLRSCDKCRQLIYVCEKEGEEYQNRNWEVEAHRIHRRMQREMEELKMEHQEEIMKLKKEHEEENIKLKREHEREMEKLKKEHEQENIKLKREHEHETKNFWRDDLPDPSVCIRDNKVRLAKYNNKCLILGYNLDLSPINPSISNRNKFCFTKDLVKQALIYLTEACGEFVPAGLSLQLQPDVRVEGEYRLDTGTVDGEEGETYRSIRVLNSDYEEVPELGIDVPMPVDPMQWELRRYNWEHRADRFTEKW
ncbi:hypothetical protein BJ508DRAFT_329210 [Ascobolus immersus RN42]|uniref:Uncharacterized protein n=1 Tax=Ascobolus immersus RN42 TaxID=1160509 RepID=A0A3N4I2K1_ASCIM|nr:hypothetical protein BJ508DRAFT_329210 [Ascobolus immersus RN42]